MTGRNAATQRFSALGQQPTKCSAANEVLFDDLVSACLERRRNSQIKSLGCFHVDDKLKAGRLLDR
jgi:hypothetical protein